MINSEVKYNSLIQRLKNTYNKQSMLDLVLYLGGGISVVSLVLVLFSVIESFANGSIEFRTDLFYAFLGFSLATLITSYILYKRKYVSKEKDYILSTSNKVGNYFPQIRDKLTNALQIYNQVNTSQGISIDLANYELESISEKTQEYNFNDVIDKKRFNKFILLFLSITFFALIITSIPGILLNPAANRIINYDQSFIPAAPFDIILKKKSSNVLRGEDVEIVISSTGNSPDKLILFIKEDNQDEYDELLIEKNSDKEYVYKLASIKNSVSYYASTQWYNSSIQTEIGKVTVSERPVVKRLTGKVNYPSYTGESPKDFDINTADIVAINGSRLTFNLDANKNIKKALMIFNSESSFIDSNGIVNETIRKSDTIALSVNNNKTNLSYTIRKSGYYFFKLYDSNGIENENPIKYSIIATTDNSPNITLINPTENVQLSENAMIQIDTEIMDDFGFTSLKLNYKLVKSIYVAPSKDYKSININIKKNEKYQLASYIWDLNSMGISPEDEYEFYLEVFDNDIVNGPKSAKTRILSIRLPSLEEVIASSEQAQKEIEKDLAEVLKDAQELKKNMEELKQDLRKDFKKKEMNYEQKKKAEDIADKQKQISENVKNLQEKINETAKEMHENKVLSPETLEKFMKLQELLKQVDIPELRKMQEKMNKELKDMTPQEMQKALEDMKFDEEQFQKSIERSMKMLERMKAEQKTDAIKKMGEKLEKDLENLMKETEKSDSKDNKENEKLAKEQDKLNKDLDKLENQMKELEDMLSKQEDMPMDKLDEANKELNKEETSEQMEQSEQNLQKGQKEKAQKNQQKAKQNMKKFNKKMSELKQEMENKVSRETLNTMKKAVQDMLQISKEQEQLKNQTNASNYNSPQLPEINNKQNKLNESLQRVANSLAQLSEKSFAVTPEMGKDIGMAMQEMNTAMSELAERRSSQAGKAQQQSMAKMNSAVSQMQGMLGQMQGQGKGKGQGKGQEGSGGNSPGMSNSPGGMGFSQQLQQAAAQQQMINNSLQQMMQQGQQEGKEGQGGKGGKSEMQKQSEYGRLKNEQGNAKKSIEELAEEQKKFQKQGGKKNIDLEEIAKEMKEVMSDMESGNITQATIERQEKILSKLLDANRSENERDFEKKREAKSGKQYSQNSPEALKLKEYLNKVSEDKLKESLKLGYTKDMEELIKRYFDKLNKGD